MLSSAFELLFTGDPGLYRIIGLSLYVSLTATLIAALIGLPLGAFLALKEFRARGAMIVFVNALMGMPPVVVGLAIFLLLSRSGPLARSESCLRRAR